MGLVIFAIFAAIIGLPATIAWSMHGGQPNPISTWISSADAQTTVKVYRMGAKSVSQVPLNDYIVNTIAAELPPTAPMAALQAAAVASRTYVIYEMIHKNTGTPTYAERHGADVTDDGLLDLPWLTEAQQAQQFGANDAAYTARLQQAVQSTDGQILTWHGEPILAFMFALSPGQTRSASDVFHRSLPYLPAIKCPDDKADPAGTQTTTFTPAQLAARLGIQAGTINPGAIHIATRGKDGFVQTVTYASKAWTGSDFANLLGLPSADFTLHVNPRNHTLQIRTRGIGTDIGMSLHEASVYAGRGESSAKILQTFYPGAAITSDTPFLTGNAAE